MLPNLLRAVERVVQIGVWINGVLLILVAVLIGADVLLRKFFSVTIGGSDEIGGYVLAISSAWAASYTLLRRGHIRMDTVYNQVGRRAQGALDIMALLALAGFMSMVAWYGTKVFLTSVDFGSRSNTPLGTPLWIPQGLWVLGLIMFLVTIAVVAAATIAALAGHRSPVITRVTGIGMAEEEARDEVEALKDRLAASGQSAEAGGR